MDDDGGSLASRRRPLTRYTFDPEVSRASFDGRSSLHAMSHEVAGIEGHVDLEVLPDGAIDGSTPPSAHLSIPVDRLRSGNSLQDNELRRRLDSSTHPNIEGELLEMTRVGRSQAYRVRGTVTLNGVTCEHEDEVMVEVIDDRAIRLTGYSTFDVRDYGISPPRLLLLKVDPMLTVRIDIRAVRPPA
ncbi:MAG: YceI family protein [Acidimicrobiales bacterium]